MLGPTYCKAFSLIIVPYHCVNEFILELLYNIWGGDVLENGMRKYGF